MRVSDFKFASDTTLDAFMTAHGASSRSRARDFSTGFPVVYFQSPTFAAAGAYTRWSANSVYQPPTRLMCYMRLMTDLHLPWDLTSEDHLRKLNNPHDGRVNQIPADADHIAQDDWRRYETIKHVGDVLSANNFPRRLTADTIWLYTHRATAAHPAEPTLSFGVAHTLILLCARIAAQPQLTGEERENLAQRRDVNSILAAMAEGVSYSFAQLLYQA